jgi:fatty-acid desaturase
MNFLKISFHTKLMAMLAIHAVLYTWAVIINWDTTSFWVMFVIYKIWHTIGNEAGLHRLWSHKSYETPRWKEFVLHLFAFPLLYGTSLTYAGVHRQHHAYSDTEKDPHITRPWWKVAFYVRNKDYEVESRFVKDLIRDPWHRWFHKHYFKLQVGLLLACLIILGPLWTGKILSLTVMHSFLAAAVLNVWGHRPNYILTSRPFKTEDQSTNSWILQFLSLNEGLHNHHHAKPQAWSFMVKKTNIDIGAWVIYYLFMTKEQRAKEKFVWTSTEI